ncbi:MAG: hypothetical protein GY697_18240 [Desulfobacterales bacterium]|nr:hypothetical protein [Desulfobacterales bacterium]
MIKLKIRMYENDETTPKTTISVPLGMLRFVSRFVPANLKESLSKKGIDVDLIADLVKSDEVRGTLVEIEEHKKNERTIISVE